MKKEKKTVYERVTDRLLEILEKGDLPPWRQPWDSPRSNNIPWEPHNAITKKPYHGINALITQIAMLEWGDPRFMTFKQANNLGARIRKGEQGIPIVYWGAMEVENGNEESSADPDDLDQNDDGIEKNEKKAKIIRFPRLYTVFNVKQIEELPQRFDLLRQDDLEKNPFSDDLNFEVIKAYINHLRDDFGAEIRFGGNKAFYIGGTNIIQLPNIESFKSIAGLAGTVLHEATHFTAPLVERDTKNYAKEEIVAELGAWMQAARLGLPIEEDQSASYISGWREALIGSMRKDSKFIFKAAKEAEKAANHVLTQDFLAKVYDLRGASNLISNDNDQSFDEGRPKVRLSI